MQKNEEKPQGGRNLCLLGLAATIIAFVSTAISLKIYHDTGDVYLDRSRPGYIFEEEEEDRPESVEFEAFPDNGKLSAEDMQKYLDGLEDIHQRIQSGDNFSSQVISDEILGIDEDAQSEGEEQDVDKEQGGDSEKNK